MKYRIYPQKSDVLAMFLARQEKAEQAISDLTKKIDECIFHGPTLQDYVRERTFFQSDLESLKTEIALIRSHAPSEIAVELED